MSHRSIATVKRPNHHPYNADPDAPADHTGARPCKCGLPQRNSVHQLPDLHEEQDAHRARIGDDQ